MHKLSLIDYLLGMVESVEKPSRSGPLPNTERNDESNPDAKESEDQSPNSSRSRLV
jgi:hypothetical protein